MVEKIRAGWSAWLFQGVPAAIVILGAVLTIGRTVGTLDQRVTALEADRIATAKQMTALTDETNQMNLNIQRLSDLLEERGDISYRSRPKRGVDYAPYGDQISAQPMPRVPQSQ